MTHSEMDELYELFLMGILDSEEAAEISAHLGRQCDYCLARIKDSEEVVQSFASLADPKQPPPELRARVMAMVQPAPRQRSQWPLAFALACAASVALLIWGFYQQDSLKRAATQVQELSRQRNELRSAVAILSESDTKTIQFGGLQSGPHGRVFVSGTGGVVFVGGQLPQLASGKTFQLWLVPAKGNPQSAGLFVPNSEGISVNVLAQSINPSQFAAVAVSVEPSGGSPQPTTKPIIIVPLG